MTSLLIAGASVRAAVGSAQRSGDYRLLAADLFSDQDLVRACRSWRLDSRYAQLAQLAARECPDFWMYTGALENHPAVIAEVSRHTRLLGHDAAAVQKIRQPAQLARALSSFDLPCPDVRTDVCPREGHWLRKPCRSAAGIGIRLAVPGEVNDTGEVYFQRLINGSACAAVFVACQGTAQLLGTTQQLSGEARFGATGFQYCGSIGPLPLNQELRRQWERIGNCLASALELKGLVGIDAVLSGGRVIPVEINPRYTASIEVLEACQSWSSIDLHLAACRDERVMIESCQPSSSYFGKAIVFAPRAAIISERLIEWIDELNGSSDRPQVADIPAASTSIGVGRPVVTVFAQSNRIDAVLPLLQQRAAEIADRLIQP